MSSFCTTQSHVKMLVREISILTVPEPERAVKLGALTARIGPCKAESKHFRNLSVSEAYRLPAFADHDYCCLLHLLNRVQDVVANLFRIATTTQQFEPNPHVEVLGCVQLTPLGAGANEARTHIGLECLHALRIDAHPTPVTQNQIVPGRTLEAEARTRLPQNVRQRPLSQRLPRHERRIPLEEFPFAPAALG